jgi:N-methylhydantoinase A/oxoprolinase/acetone carboxylase beta subunit
VLRPNDELVAKAEGDVRAGLIVDRSSVVTNKVSRPTTMYAQSWGRSADSVTRTRSSCRRGTEAVHGTTLCSNAILEGKDARPGLITTRGFRDALEFCSSNPAIPHRDGLAGEVRTTNHDVI